MPVKPLNVAGGIIFIVFGFGLVFASTKTTVNKGKILLFALGLIVIGSLLLKTSKKYIGEDALNQSIEGFKKSNKVLKGKLTISGMGTTKVGTNCFNFTTDAAFTAAVSAVNTAIANVVATHNLIVSSQACKAITGTPLNCFRISTITWMNQTFMNVCKSYGITFTGLPGQGLLTASGSLTTTPNPLRNNSAAVSLGGMYTCPSWCTGYNVTTTTALPIGVTAYSDGAATWTAATNYCSCPPGFYPTLASDTQTVLCQPNTSNVNLSNTQTTFTGTVDLPVIIPAVSGSCGAVMGVNC